MVTELTKGKLRGLLTGGVAGTLGWAVLCCVPGERHDVGLLALAVLLHAEGWSVLYLGADTPLAEAADVAADRSAALGVSATMPALAHEAERELALIGERNPSLTIVRGGTAFGGDSAADAVREPGPWARSRVRSRR